MIRRFFVAVAVGGLSIATATANDAVDLLARLHAKKWQDVVPADVKRMTSTHFTERADEYAPSSGVAPNCKPSLYLIASDETSGRITLEFEPVAKGRECRQTLYSAAIEWHGSHNAAQLFRNDVLNALKPGGKGGPSATMSDYEWRSRDSRTRYSLHIDLQLADPNPTPSTPTTVKVILQQEPCEPVDVDDLPFAKGVMLRCRP